ncbi:LysR family transcriptional regulator ArgP [Desulforhopalus singaporensis]|uniref:LysR family transcriptional regulator, chromosome initiation inhibitor n=1 Tax=Desulforhopalus singaporensis TaxID=91360 RepID=A0A1H0J4A7_9BACT|nr:LysR family transcriptional regulator ArgP [Desulforhopalus singaporensis]SDO38555.1 LysR family transcriptional regulator, chromosome initiation inhibitor [Desulforhopalus singaporensis]
MLDYKLLEAMAAVIREGGFDKGARVLNITQSAVSQRIRQLEELTGQVLVIRSSPPEATAAGKKMMIHYQQVRHLEEDLLTNNFQQSEHNFTTLGIALNADSLATWFLPAIATFAREEKVLLDLAVDDQDQTHKLLKNGDVVGCISTKSKPIQGCRTIFLGTMTYHMSATPEFAAKWFPEALTVPDACRAPAVIFNRKDELHDALFSRMFGKTITVPAHYVPSTETFMDFIVAGLGYGMVPFQQSRHLFESGCLVDLAPGSTINIDLYWHCWNLQSKLLDKLSRLLIFQAKVLLDT